ncbi:MAG: lysophospholipid acyltransferase family protein [Anaerolineales bacterium]
MALIRRLISLFVKLIARVELRGAENIPATGGCILAANHLGRLDLGLVYYVVPRDDIILVIAEKYQKYRLARWFARTFNAIFINRHNADFAAVRAVLKRLQSGQVLAIAPEGTRSKSGSLLPGQPGACYLASKANVPIIPIAATGAQDTNVLAHLKRLRRPHITITIGEPFSLPPLQGNREAQLQTNTDEIMCRIAALLPPEYRGHYAEHPRLQQLLTPPAPQQP